MVADGLVVGEGGFVGGGEAAEADAFVVDTDGGAPAVGAFDKVDAAVLGGAATVGVWRLGWGGLGVGSAGGYSEDGTGGGAVVEREIKARMHTIMFEDGLVIRLGSGNLLIKVAKVARFALDAHGGYPATSRFVVADAAVLGGACGTADLALEGEVMGGDEEIGAAAVQLVVIEVDNDHGGRRIEEEARQENDLVLNVGDDIAGAVEAPAVAHDAGEVFGIDEDVELTAVDGKGGVGHRVSRDE